MNNSVSEADRHLIEQVRAGSAEGWSQLVARYEKRLLAFARSRLRRASEAEDLVQETFVSFLGSISTFRQQFSIETFLFTILRRKIIDHFRGRASRVCFLQEALGGRDEDSGPAVVASVEPTASRVGQSAERREQVHQALVEALSEYLNRLRDSENFRDLKIAELIFYAQVRNKDAAELLNMDEKQIALIKHRAVKEISAAVRSRVDGLVEFEPSDATMFTEVWEDMRLTCPKRSTLGRFQLGTLDGPWREYVDFHVNTLRCGFCRANLDDLDDQTLAAAPALRDRVMQSTIGFFRKP